MLQSGIYLRYIYPDWSQLEQRQNRRTRLEQIVKIGFLETPPVGIALKLGDQPFRLIRIDPHVRRDGVQIELLVWSSECAACGAPFETKAPVHSLPEGRRCDEHKRPGRKA